MITIMNVHLELNKQQKLLGVEKMDFFHQDNQNQQTQNGNSSCEDQSRQKQPIYDNLYHTTHIL